MDGQRCNWRLSTTKRISSSATSCVMYPRPPPHVIAMARSKSTSNNAISSNNQQHRNSTNNHRNANNNNGQANTVEAELRRRKERREEKERIAKLKREYKSELSRAKRAKYSTASLSAHGVLRDLKNSTQRSMTNIKNSFDNLVSQVCYRNTNSGKDGGAAYDHFTNYYEPENDIAPTPGPRTPVKMYSPFGITESPAPPTPPAFRQPITLRDLQMKLSKSKGKYINTGQQEQTIPAAEKVRRVFRINNRTKVRPESR